MSQVLIAIVDDEQPVRDATKALAACSRFVLLEKVIPWARIAYLGSVIFVAAGAWLLSTTMF